METLGQKLKAAREKKRATLSKAAAMTRIKIQNLEMMENDDFSRMPAPTYAKGFIRIYANFLGLDPAPLVQEYVDRHLNPPAAGAPRAEAEPAAPPVEETDSAKKTTASPATLLAALASGAQRALEILRPHYARLGIALAIVLIVMLISRCVSGIGDSGDSSAGQKMRAQSIAKEPAERYLELPAAETKP